MRALEAAGIECEVVDLSTDPEALARLKAAGFLQAPVVETVDQSWSGFRPDKIDDVAKRAILPSDATREARSPAR
jgi:glutaredoxin-like protein NrdH